jgi:hypothetical protein
MEFCDPVDVFHVAVFHCLDPVWIIHSFVLAIEIDRCGPVYLIGGFHCKIVDIAKFCCVEKYEMYDIWDAL